MIGFDRPLKPRWIYDSLLLAEPGQKLIELNEPFEGIAKELTGKEGKRKVRTVLFRCFIRDERNRGRVKEDLILRELSMKYGQDFMLPIYLFYLIGKTEIIFSISKHLFRLYDFSGKINVKFLRQHMVNRFGDRNVVKKATGAFIKTLSFFSIVEYSKNGTYLKKKLPLSEKQLRIILTIYAKEILRTPQVNLNDLPRPLFNYFLMPEVRIVAQKNNGTYWDYQHRMGSDLLIIY